MSRALTRVARHRATPPALVTCAALLAAALILPVPFAGAQDAERQEARACTCRVGPEGRERDWTGTWDGEACVCRTGPGELVFGVPWAAVDTVTQAFARAFAVRPGRALLGISYASEAVEGEPGGVRVTGVSRDSGAEEAGLRRGDVIVAFDDHDLADALPEEPSRPLPSQAVWRFTELARDLEAGDTVRIVYLRDGERHEALVEARSLPGVWTAWGGPEGRWEASLPGRVVRPERPQVPRIEVRRTPTVVPSGFMTTWTTRSFGLELRDLNEDLGQYFGRSEGVVVLDVADDARLPLRAGDVLLTIADRDVRDAAHAHEILRSYRSGEEIEVRVLREGSEIAVRGQAR